MGEKSWILSPYYVWDIKIKDKARKIKSLKIITLRKHQSQIQVQTHTVCFRLSALLCFKLSSRLISIVNEVTVNGVFMPYWMRVSDGDESSNLNSFRWVDCSSSSSCALLHISRQCSGRCKTYLLCQSKAWCYKMVVEMKDEYSMCKTC